MSELQPKAVQIRSPIAIATVAPGSLKTSALSFSGFGHDVAYFRHRSAQPKLVFCGIHF